MMSVAGAETAFQHRNDAAEVVQNELEVRVQLLGLLGQRQDVGQIVRDGEVTEAGVALPGRHVIVRIAIAGQVRSAHRVAQEVQADAVVRVEQVGHHGVAGGGGERAAAAEQVARGVGHRRARADELLVLGVLVDCDGDRAAAVSGAERDRALLLQAAHHVAAAGVVRRGKPDVDGLACGVRRGGQQQSAGRERAAAAGDDQGAQPGSAAER